MVGVGSIIICVLVVATGVGVAVAVVVDGAAGCVDVGVVRVIYVDVGVVVVGVVVGMCWGCRCLRCCWC